MTQVLITAGPTHEPIDAVRFIGNRSSGRMGLALAQACIDRGWSVTLLLGPSPHEPPMDSHLRTRRFQTASELERLMQGYWSSHDLLIMASAVADYRPSQSHQGKLRRGGDTLTLTLEPTPDLVAQAASAKRPDQAIIAFALEPSDQLAARAHEKLMRKGVDAMVANPLHTMESEDIEAMVLSADGSMHSPPPCVTSKTDFAKWLIDAVAADLLVTDLPAHPPQR